MVRLLELLLIIGAGSLFALVIIPLGAIAAGGFLALIGGLSARKASGEANIQVGTVKVSWKGAIAVGIVVAGVLIIILQD